MALKYPTIRVRRPFARARAVLYEDYLAVENLHSLGMSGEESRTYYDEVRWVLRFHSRDWYRAAHALLVCFPLLVGILILVLSEHWIASAIGLAFTVPSGVWFFYSLFRLIAIRREVAWIVSLRGTVELGVDWPKSANRLKDAGVFFETLLGKLKLVAAMPAPPAPAPVVVPPPEAVSENPPAVPAPPVQQPPVSAD